MLLLYSSCPPLHARPLLPYPHRRRRYPLPHPTYISPAYCLYVRGECTGRLCALLVHILPLCDCMSCDVSGFDAAVDVGHDERLSICETENGGLFSVRSTSVPGPIGAFRQIFCDVRALTYFVVVVEHLQMFWRLHSRPPPQ